MIRRILPLALLLLAGCSTPYICPIAEPPQLVVLGVAQDAGIPQAGSFDHPGWDDPERRRRVVSLGLVSRRSGRRWMIEATPDFRDQLTILHRFAGPGRRALDGIFVTHAHIGHYAGLMFLGHESMGAREIPVWAMPRMGRFLETNGPWSQLVAKRNIRLHPLADRRPVTLEEDLSITPLLVPHRDEFSECVGFIIRGPRKAVLFLPDIDRWDEWEDAGTRIEDVLAEVDVAYVDGTFHADGEIPGRDMSGFPHPKIVESMRRFAPLPAAERAKVRFIHFNHTNPVQDATSPAAREVLRAGFGIAEEGEVVEL